MKLMLLHLSDIHITSSSCSIFSKLDALTSALQPIQADACCLILSGDIASAGTEPEYAACLTFLSALQEKLRAALRFTKLDLIIVPGNHDCDFTNDAGERTALISELSHQTSSISDLQLGQGLAAQSHFFDFLELATPDAITAQGLYHQEVFVYGDNRLVFHCYNTSWLSERHERPSSLLFPISSLPTIDPTLFPSVSVLHHPLDWFRRDHAKQLGNRLALTSDLILSGHEHESSWRKQEVDDNPTNVYIEGGALQSSSQSDASSFNVIVLDFSTLQQRFFQFDWRHGNYHVVNKNTDWRDSLAARDHNGLVLTHEFSSGLDDLGAGVQHPMRGYLKLSDVFVYPDLKLLMDGLDERTNITSGETFLDSFGLHEPRFAVINGPEKSGKTSFAKIAFRDLRKKGYSPLYIDGTSLAGVAGLERSISAAIKSSYADALRYSQLDRTKRALLVDGLIQAKLRDGGAAFLDELAMYADHVLVLTDDLPSGFTPSTAGNLRIDNYRLLPYGHRRRSELVEKWYRLDVTLANDPGRFSRKVVAAQHMTNTAIGKDFVPSFPMFIIPMLQAAEYNQQVNIHVSTFGYFYEILIRQCLASGATSVGYDIKVSYLGFLAFHFFANDIAAVNDRQLREVHAAFENDAMIIVNFADLMKSFADSRLLERRQDEYRFKYPYIYYYFLANYLSTHITEDGIMKIIVALCENIAQAEHASILLFLVHLSKDPFIITQLDKTASSLLAEVARADLSKSTAPDIEVGPALEAEYVEGSTAENRRRLLDAADDLERHSEEEDQREGHEGDSKAREHAARVRAASRAMKIIGQIVKNFPGSIRGLDKVKLVDQCYGIGLRLVGSFDTLLSEHADEIVEAFLKASRREDPFSSHEAFVRFSRKVLFTYHALVCFLMLKKISSSVGSPDLLPVYDHLRQRDLGCAAEELIYISIRLDQALSFPRREVEDFARRFHSNQLALAILRGMVVTHFHLFDESTSLKQSVCKKLGISYRTMSARDPRSTVLARSAQGRQRRKK